MCSSDLENAVVILAADGDETPVSRTSKAAVADAVWDRVRGLLEGTSVAGEPASIG